MSELIERAYAVPFEPKYDDDLGHHDEVFSFEGNLPIGEPRPRRGVYLYRLTEEQHERMANHPDVTPVNR